MQTAHPPHLAIFGTFDVENYGDLLFPLIARHRLDPHGITVVPVSPTACRTRYGDAMAPVAQAEFARQAEGFAGVLIGGGNIVHLRDFGLPGYAPTAYPALWIGATALAVRHRMPVLWNAPGVLAPRDTGAPPDWLRRTVAAADHFVVRDGASADDLARWSGRRAAVMPDSALDLGRLWPEPALAARHRDIRARAGLPPDRRIVAIHVKRRSLGRLDPASFAQALTGALAAADATAILLAIGRCHGDHEVAAAIHAAAPLRTLSLADATALEEIAAVIAGAAAYLGASLHGHITAAAYGVPSRLVAVPALAKFAGQARQMDRSDEVVPDWPTALRDLPAVVAAPRRPLPDAIPAALDAHWTEIARRVLGGPSPPRAAIFDGADPDAALDTVIRVGTVPLAPAADAAIRGSVSLPRRPEAWT
jgi:hypothetical protein